MDLVVAVLDEDFNMSKTYKLKEYKNGKPIYTRHLNKDAPYHWFMHDHPVARKALNRSYRMKLKQRFKKFGDILPFRKSNGWETN